MNRAAALGCVLAVVALAAVPLPVWAHTNDVHADSQVSADGTVVAETVFVAEDGWLVLYRNGSANGTYSGLLGHVAVESGGGLQRDVAVEVPDTRWRSFGPAATVHFVVHHDDGDGSFEPRGDDPVLSSFGSPVAASFTLGKGETAALVTARGFAPQDPNASSATVRRATLPADGHLVVSEETEAGQVLGHASLSAGTHRNVTVALNRSRLDHREDESSARSLRTTLYRDDGDGEFDDSDRPIRAEHEPVATTFHVRLEGVVSTDTHDEHSTETHGETHDHSGTSTTSTTPSPTVTPTSTPSSVGAGSTSAPDGTSGLTTTPAGTGGDGDGFGPAVALVALAALTGGVLARRDR